MISFAHPILLWGLGVLGVPLALHLMNRAVPIRHYFPSIRFIRRARLPRDGRRRLRDLLLLLLRLSLLAVLVLFFAGPSWKPEEERPAASNTERTEAILVVDKSSSIAGWGSDAAVSSKAFEVIATLEDVDIGLVVYSDRVLFDAAPGMDAAEIKKQIEQSTPEPVAGNPATALRKALGLLNKAAGARIYFFSDFQQSDWDFSLLPEVPSEVDVQFIEVNPQRSENAGITGVTVSRLSAETLRILVDVRNFGMSKFLQTVRLQLGSKQYIEELTLPPLATRKTAFTVQKPDSSSGEVVLAADPYEADNHWYFWAGALPPVNLLVVAPLEQEPSKREELFFITKALQVHDEVHPTRFELQTVEPEFLFALNLAGVDGILMLGAGGYFHQAEWELVKNYLENGGLVLCTPGRSSAHTIRSLRSYDLLRAEYRGVKGEYSRSYEGYGLGWVDSQGTLGEVFQDASKTDLFAFPIYKYVDVQLFEAPQQRSILKMIDGAPALIEANLGKGVLFVATFAFDSSWSDLPMTGSFLPLLRPLLDQAVPANQGVKRVECGQDVTIGADLLQMEQQVQIQELDTRIPQVFLLGNMPVEINVPRSESLLETLNLLDLSDALSSTSSDSAIAGVETAGISGSAGKDVVELWPWLAMAAALLFLGDLGLAAWFDRRELRNRSQV